MAQIAKIMTKDLPLRAGLSLEGQALTSINRTSLKMKAIKTISISTQSSKNWERAVLVPFIQHRDNKREATVRVVIQKLIQYVLKIYKNLKTKQEIS